MVFNLTIFLYNVTVPMLENVSVSFKGVVLKINVILYQSGFNNLYSSISYIVPNAMIFFLIYKSKKFFYFSFSSCLIKASGLLHLMKLLRIYQNILEVYVTVTSLFNLVKPLKRTRIFSQLKPVL